MLTLTFFDTDFASNTMNTAADMFSAFNPYITLVLGVLLAIVAIAFIVGVLVKH